MGKGPLFFILFDLRLGNSAYGSLISKHIYCNEYMKNFATTADLSYTELRFLS